MKTTQLQGVKILLIDDAVESRMLVASVLDRFGATTEQAGSAEKGREILQGFEPDLIICDIGMPSESGIDFMKRFRTVNYQTPAMALTAYTRDEEKKKCLRAGFQSHVGKPIQPKNLIEEIQRLLEKRLANHEL